MDSFESILFIIYSVVYCVRDTQGMLTHQVLTRHIELTPAQHDVVARMRL